MKINDKHLAAFATSNSPVDKQGFMMKRGEVNKAFQKRWFMLKGNLLFYFDKRGDRDPIGVIILEGCTVELAESTDAYTFEIGFQGVGSRTYVLAAETQDDMESWMKAITCAGYDYMKLMVAELQRQLDELNSSKNNFTQQWDITSGASAAGGISTAGSTGPVVSSTRGQGLLVDLSVPESPPKHSHQMSRHNPFNEMDDNLDLFGATPFVTDGSTVKQRSAGPRDFEAMHEQYGQYIKKKMREATIRS